jgi:hypothetical protein
MQLLLVVVSVVNWDLLQTCKVKEMQLQSVITDRRQNEGSVNNWALLLLLLMMVQAEPRKTRRNAGSGSRQ